MFLEIIRTECASACTEHSSPTNGRVRSGNLGQFTNINVNKLQTLQKKAVTFIYDSYDSTSITNLLQQSGVMSVSKRNRTCRLQLFFKLIKYIISSTPHILTYSAGYSTRHRYTLPITPLNPRNNWFKYYFFPRTMFIVMLSRTKQYVSAFENHLSKLCFIIFLSLLTFIL